MLTPKQERFVQNLIKGMSQREAYRDAYPNSKASDKGLDEMASRLFNKSKIKARYDELIQKTEDEAIMSAIERKKWLTKVINGEVKEKVSVLKTNSNGESEMIEQEFPSKLDTKLKALDTLNKMSGAYVTKVEGDLNTDVNINIELTDEL